MFIDERYMRRAIELARHGLGYVSPNPMVGAVIVHNGKIIGEGYHRRYGEGHAEVNAIASVRKPELLTDSTIYVTLEPCSHYGKTPPCAKLIIDKKIPRIVVGSLDPFKKVSGRGINMLREAGAEVVTGILEKECLDINKAFMKAHSTGMPWVTLKWAQSADGYIDSTRNDSAEPVKFSTRLTTALMHRQRILHDAIMVGSGTVIADNPSLTARMWPGRNPRPVIADRRRRITAERQIFSASEHKPLFLHGNTPAEYLKELYGLGITSVLVEGGAKLLNAFLESGLWDEARIEVSPIKLHKGIKAPTICGIPSQELTIDGNTIFRYSKSL
ncbi:MAG: bifunctional diaminohydroxyphosphoribosylaminopyrimidine deaminase/5-amino-6-(5-phosphoribosylamino)uracil reductase RibD [Muribaculum sp.]|nr:bifunctional diaminohydroxyphosphoribosylaminopyrimidine deaminase/5-amino-6-(5-phosphoribosylamino)uracil reductase RibD [Muribaculum sp.]